MSNSNFVDEIMGFDGSSLESFNQKKSYGDDSVYKTSPKNSKSDDGNYHSKLRIILNPKNPKMSILPVTTYWVETMNGKRLVTSLLSKNDTNCPIFQCWKRHWYKADDARKNELKEIFQRNNLLYVIVQILEDENQPDMVGKFKYMKLARDTYDKISEAMNPSPASGKQPYPMMDYVIGKVLEMNVKPGPKIASDPSREQRDISYSLCNFTDYASIIKTDGTPLFDDDEIDLIDNYYNAFNDSKNGKTAKKKEEAVKKLESLREDVRKIYEKAISYVTENLKHDDGTDMNLEEDMGYMPWDDATTKLVEEFCQTVDAGMDPRKESYMFAKKDDSNSVENIFGAEPSEPEPEEAPKEDSDLPF